MIRKYHAEELDQTLVTVAFLGCLKIWILLYTS